MEGGGGEKEEEAKEEEEEQSKTEGRQGGLVFKVRRLLYHSALGRE